MSIFSDFFSSKDKSPNVSSPVLSCLFLDDERFPPRDGRSWAVARNVPEAIDWVIDNGFPDYISFDHDLGEDALTGFDFANWLINLDLDHGTMPDAFSFVVHSQNPVGAENIRNVINNYLNYRKQEKDLGNPWPPLLNGGELSSGPSSPGM